MKIKKRTMDELRQVKDISYTPPTSHQRILKERSYSEKVNDDFISFDSDCEKSLIHLSIAKSLLVKEIRKEGYNKISTLIEDAMRGIIIERYKINK